MVSEIKPVSRVLSGLILAIVVGTFAYSIKSVINYPAADTLAIALVLGITIRSFIGEQSGYCHVLYRFLYYYDFINNDKQDEI